MERLQENEMDIGRILAELKNERDRLDCAIAAIQGINSSGPGRRGPGARNKRRGRRRMSAAARRRISEMMKQRWAERKKRSRAA
jgi:50S ribosomal subunit-associated GTPase HflX